MNDKVKIFRYVTEGTFDSYSWQLIENKQKFIGQIMTSKSPVRSCEDIDEAALTYAEVKALATGNPYIKEKMDLDIQVSKLKLLKANHTSQKYRLEDNIVKHYPVQIASMKERLAGYRADIQTYAQNKFPDKDTFSIKIGNRVYTDKKEAGAALIDMCRSAKQPNMAVTIGEYQGFKMSVSFDSFFSKFTVNLKGSITHEVEIGTDPLGNLQRLSNALEGMTGKMEIVTLYIVFVYRSRNKSVYLFFLKSYDRLFKRLESSSTGFRNALSGMHLRHFAFGIYIYKIICPVFYLAAVRHHMP